MLNGTDYAQHYERGFTRTVRLLCSMGVDEEDARENAQAAWARGWERRDQLRDPERTLSWVNSIALNMCRTEFRRRKKEERPFPALPAIPPASAMLDAAKVLNLCEETAREMMKEYYLAGLRMKEIAARHRCSEVAVRIRLFRTRRMIRDRIADGYARQAG